MANGLESSGIDGGVILNVDFNELKQLEAQAMKTFTKAELNEMTMAELTEIHNQHTGKGVKKLKGAKSKAIAEILSAQDRAAKAADAPKKPSTRALLRTIFSKVGEQKRTEDVLAEVINVAQVKPETLWVTISDLKNPKVAGKQGTLVLERDGEFLKRVA